MRVRSLRLVPVTEFVEHVPDDRLEKFRGHATQGLEPNRFKNSV